MKALRIRRYEGTGMSLPQADGALKWGILLDLDPLEKYATFDYDKEEWVPVSGYRKHILLVDLKDCSTYEKFPEGFENHILELWTFCGTFYGSDRPYVGVILTPV